MQKTIKTECVALKRKKIQIFKNITKLKAQWEQYFHLLKR